ncbi:hypothetical protein E1A91_A02G086900v1 [Gossypium mustelinum]|uniref:Uncharacterized protein n=3 Tax=Gossypium TaxID=3633 RepID=A0A5J5WN55_GOSBA|nr:hypothetical protein ES319_A02G083300v1 [Gossypium barbadense]TYH27742.1 hypothetical protein ES288_A02G092300v1 [Gossypium darwinii]TYJ45896.1 hypothetical protein E1A91_A02G086900v1 [Gossypium mustelinum]
MKSLGNAPHKAFKYPSYSPQRREQPKMLRSKALMANLRMSSKKDVVVVAGGRSKLNDKACKKHPKHRQSPGVCSLCLREKLLQLSASSSSGSTTTITTIASSCSSSLSSYSSSSSASSYSSPMHRYPFPTEGKDSFSLFFSGKNILTKSRSVAFSSRLRSNRTGFFSKLLLPRNTKRKEESF